MSTGKIIRNKEEEQIYFDLLKRHFKSVESYEKYPDATLNLLFSSTVDKILGKNFTKKRISQRKENKIKNIIAQKLRSKYGKWISFTNFKIKPNLIFSCATNLSRIYKVNDRGILYGCPSHQICGNIFLTSHCLERFEKRADPAFYAPIIPKLKIVLKTEPDLINILITLIQISNLEYGYLNEFCYLNIFVGFLVVENLGDVFITKTFMTPEMVKENLKWYQAEIGDENETHSFADVLKSPCHQIKGPTFIQDYTRI